MAGRRIVVTGGAGFIGSNFVWKCNQQGLTDILIVDELNETEKWRNLVGLQYEEYLHKDAFLAMISQNQLSTEIDAVIHMGACSATTEKNMDYLMHNNVKYTRLLAEWCLTNNVRFIYASSAATYGNGDQGFDDNEDMLEALRPINPYGYSKQLFDIYAKNRGHLDKIAGLKFFNVFGPNEYHKESMMSVVCKMYPGLVETGEMKLFKSYREGYDHGEQKRDFIYVKDCAEVMWWLMENPDVNGIFNLGTGTAKSWNDLARAMFKATGKPENITYIDMPEGLEKQYQYFTEANMDKLKAAGCPVALTPLEEAVEDYVVNYLSTQARLDTELVNSF